MAMLYLFSKDGEPLDVVDASVRCSWVLGGEGEMAFAVSIYDPKCRRELLDFGNLVLFEHEKLPPWGGVLDLPREWGRGAVMCRAYSGMRFFRWRIIADMGVMGGRVADLMGQLLQPLQQPPAFPIRLGSEAGNYGHSVNLEYRPTAVADLLMQAQAALPGYFEVEPRRVGRGWLEFIFDYREYGGDKILAAQLSEGLNLAEAATALAEQGAIANDLLGYGEGASWSETPKARAEDPSSIHRYGRRQEARFFPRMPDQAALAAAVEAALKITAWPRATADLGVADVGDTWERMRLGRLISVDLASYGFQDEGFGQKIIGRIHGMEFDEGRGTLRIIIKSDAEAKAENYAGG